MLCMGGMLAGGRSSSPAPDDIVGAVAVGMGEVANSRGELMHPPTPSMKATTGLSTQVG